MSRSEGEYQAGIDALSGPVVRSGEIPAFAVTVIGSHGRLDLSGDGDTARRLDQILSELSARLIAQS